jgi:cytochrome c oxidase assembly protein subunit 15
MHHGFARFLVGGVLLLILAGSLVTSHAASLSVPDWSTSYGWNMLTFPRWQAGFAHIASAQYS